MRAALFLLLGALSRQGAAALPAQQRTPADSVALQGAWTMLSGAIGGLPLSADYVKMMTRVASGSEVTVTMAGNVFLKATYRLDPTRTPKWIEYHMTGGPSTGATQLGIYAIAGDTVRFCFGSPNAPRPTDFTTVTGDGRTLSVWVRAKP